MLAEGRCVTRSTRSYPFGTEDRNALTMLNHSCGSLKASATCAHFHCLPVTSRPTLFLRIRAAAMRFSSLFSQRTSAGLPRRAKQIRAKTTVQEPKNIEIDLQGASPPCFSAWEPMPYITSEAMMPKPALADCQKSEREECSSVRYQEPTTSTKPGEIVHSKKPCRPRMAMRWDQFWAAPTQKTQTPASFDVSCLSDSNNGTEF